MESRTTKSISIRTVRGNARRAGFTNGLTNGNTNGLKNTPDGRTLRKSSVSEKKHGKILVEPRGLGRGRSPILALAVLCFLVLGVFAVLTYQSPQKNRITPDTFSGESIARNVESASTKIKGTAHAPIHITSNSDFASQASANGWPGDGTQGNPYIIEGYEIDGQGGTYCIWIENTTVWFVIRNCAMWNATSPASAPWGAGIYLKNVTNGILENNDCSGNSRNGIHLESSSNNNIANNNCSGNGDGIRLESSSYNTLANNNCSGNSYGIRLESSSYNTITNNNCFGNSTYGIDLESSSNNTITNNNCSGNSYGIMLESSSYNTITNNNCSSNTRDGISLVDSSSSNTITNNNCSGNSWEGIYLWHSSNNTITNNTLWNNGIVIGIGIGGDSLEDWNTHVIENNTVNGKPAYYYKNQNGGTVPSDAGQVILANCTNMVVSGLTLTHATIGVQLAFSSSNTITNNNCSGNYHGIDLYSSSNNNITNNNCSYNWDDIYLYSSSNNNITNNNCSGNSTYGIDLESSSNNTITNNNCSDNGVGIYLFVSSNNTITNNHCSDNRNGIYLLVSSNTITNNNCSGNSEEGIFLGSSSNNTITYNTFYQNTKYAINITYGSTGNTIHHNNFWQNNGAGKGLSGNCQAYDSGTGNIWCDNTTKEGNYWSNWDGSGWGTPNAYPIAGDAGAYDMYPLTNPTPELSPLTLILVALGLLCVAALRKRK